jgi:hypothetical protein
MQFKSAIFSKTLKSNKIRDYPRIISCCAPEKINRRGAEKGIQKSGIV